MVLETGKYYHLYNRSLNDETVFKEEKNYLFFLERYQLYVGEFVSTLAYCLMPTHFHFIIKIITPDCESLKKNITTLLDGYTKAINSSYARNGSLFYPIPETKEIDDENYLLTLILYVHQNPVRAELVNRIGDWKYSSYAELVGTHTDTIADKSFIREHFPSAGIFRKYSEETITEVKKKYWV